MILERDRLTEREASAKLTDIETAIDELLEEHAIAFLKHFNDNVSKVNYEALSVYYKDFLWSIENEK